MRLKTIWTLPAMSMAERLRRTVDWAALTTAIKMPKRIRYWAAMVAIGKATSTGPFFDKDIMGATLDEILQNLEGGPE